MTVMATWRLIKKQMRKDGVSHDDIKIMSQWAKLNNKIMNVMGTGNQKKIDMVVEKAQSGKFRLLTDATTTAPREGAVGQTNVNYWSLTACGITYGQTSHENPPITINKNDYGKKANLQAALVSDGYHQIPLPWTDYGDVGLDYGKKNTTGVGGCNEGEFRNQNFIYSNTVTHVYGGITSSGWHTLQQLNEPNPEINTYDAPTFWWDVYTTFWHYDN